MTPQAELIKKQATARLDKEAAVHRSSHQNVHARRYIMPNPALGGVEIVIIVKGSNLQLWCEARAIDGLAARVLGGEGRPGTETYSEPRKYGRHSALKTMDRLHRGDAWRFIPKTIGNLDAILDAVKGAR
ncbi:hypothetical protein FHS26_001585 [Rhizobium pisi]|uniref:Uncharacterized protein n=1 Tax=Rhizobium pisi TaxID=574561 RepID=A0A427N4T9_9HYPH|nr:hypothetical protein [Rhizobium pisi]MBB3133872.1 hypothetical protein [Rhizobium pisi]RSB81853.1 hypothetical protein EFD55_07880 [Rhizobium pisi]TCA39278.1 hypothetical protein E0J16_35170 [Rhizobium pisi]